MRMRRAPEWGDESTAINAEIGNPDAVTRAPSYSLPPTLPARRPRPRRRVAATGHDARHVRHTAARSRSFPHEEQVARVTADLAAEQVRLRQIGIDVERDRLLEKNRATSQKSATTHEPAAENPCRHRPRRLRRD